MTATLCRSHRRRSAAQAVRRASTVVMVMAISLPSDLVRPVRSALAVVLGVLLLAACSDEQASPAAPGAVQQTEPQQIEPAEQGQERQPQRAAVPAPAQPQGEDRAPAQDEDRAPAQDVSTVIHLVDGEPPVFEATTASEALKFFRNWQHQTRSLAVELWVELVVNGESRRLAVDVRQDQRSGAYESSTAFDDAPAQRVLWTADGFWTANNPELEPKWSPATRARIGFGEVEVYDPPERALRFPPARHLLRAAPACGVRARREGRRRQHGSAVRLGDDGVSARPPD